MRRFSSLRWLVMAAAAVLSACGTVDVPSGLPMPQHPMALQQQPPTAAPEGEVMGGGDARVALLVPLGAEGNGGRVAAELRNAAALALEDTGRDVLEIVVKDTGGTEGGAAAAAERAMAEGAALVLGPLFAQNVRAAAPAVAGRATLIAFSSDSAVAGPGVYLNAYPPEGLAERVLSHAVGNGLRDVVAIVPEGPAGDLAERAARHALERAGGRLTAVARYEYDNASVHAAAQEVAMAVEAADALFLPDGGNSPSAIVATLRGLGTDLEGTRLLGTGQWASVDLSDPALEGAWFADTDRARMDLYRARYEERYGTEPSVTSALAYDSVVLAATLARQYGPHAFTPVNLELASGFAGYTGTFRFRPDGTPERGYAVYEVREGTAHLLSPAPTGFAGS